MHGLRRRGLRRNPLWAPNQSPTLLEVALRRGTLTGNGTTTCTPPPRPKRPKRPNERVLHFRALTGRRALTRQTCGRPGSPGRPSLCSSAGAAARAVVSVSVTCSSQATSSPSHSARCAMNRSGAAPCQCSSPAAVGLCLTDTLPQAQPAALCPCTGMSAKERPDPAGVNAAADARPGAHLRIRPSFRPGAAVTFRTITASWSAVPGWTT